MSVNFNEILNTPVEDVKKPPLPPLGSYLMGVIKNEVREITSKKDGTEYDVVEFTLRGIAPQEDVDTTELQAYGEPKNIILRRSFMFNRSDETAAKTTLYNLKRFITEHLNVEWPEGKPLKAVLPQTTNAQCIATVAYRPDPQDPENQFAEIKSTTTAQA